VKAILLVLGLLMLSPSAGWAQETESTPQGIEIGPHVFGALRARGIGPAVMSGRISALDVVDSDPRIIYAGAASGGVWKSKNGGVNFRPVFDDHNQCIGSVAVDQAHPDTVWVGTGEAWVRNSVSVGDGLYRTYNGGDKWERVGLENTERIGKIIVHPTDSNVVYAAALGHLWDANEERGLYKTSDGGATWDKILFVDENTGCTDVAIDPAEPDILYAAMWQFRRQADFFTSGGPGSGLYKSTDGGQNWRRLEEGLPPGELGRIALAVAPAEPNRIYATVEAVESALYRSDDKGETWEKKNTQKAIKGRPFYFSLLIPDPVDPDRVYKTSNGLLVTRDGGKTFTRVGGWVHVDYHAMWINPADPTHIIVGNDGGLYMTHNRGNGWRHVPNLPVSQFYKVGVDDRRPYHVYGGLQDNGSWTAPSRSRGGIENSDWENLGGGDGFAVVVDRADPDIVYWEWQGGNVSRRDLRTGENKDIKPQPRQGDPEFRFGWNTPIALSPSDDSRLYVGSQFLHRSTDRGESWKAISGDLTTNDPDKQRQTESGGLTVDNTTAENHCTIFTISESPLDKRLIWVGTDDGNIQVTEDDGDNWRLVSGGIEGLPDGTWVSCIEPSRHDRGTAFATFDGHRAGDMTPHVYVTNDLGQTWRSITTADITGYAHVVRQDFVNGDLLFLGTEFGLFITLDGGLHWARFEEEFPPVSIRDMVIQERESALVMGTHGRGIQIIDDLRPLRQLTTETLAVDVALLDSRPAALRTPQWKQHSPGDDYFVAGNPSSSAQIVYFLKKRHMFGEMKIEIFTPEGELLKTLPGSKRKGLNFVRWSPRLKPPKVAPSPTLNPSISFAASFGPTAPEGTYTYRLTKGKNVYEGTVDVGYDEDFPHSAEERTIQQQIVGEVYDLLGRLAYVADAAVGLRDDVRERAELLEEKDELVPPLRSFADQIDDLHQRIMVSGEVQGISGQKRTWEKMLRLYGTVGAYGGRPTASQVDRLAVLRGEIEVAEQVFGELVSANLEELNGKLAEKELEPLHLLTEEEFAARDN
jgi:photosystem II stability/assembly factor-like uncharacterized protein